ncbi:MAG: hypothetical protein GYA48_12445 [Chloroflexi bacterium]|nr:hypothetical protein [Chloroflexota bacterium]
MKIKRLPLILFGILCLSLACNLPLQNNNPPAPTSPVEIIAPTIPPSTGGDLPTQPEQTGTSLPLSTPQGNLAHQTIAISANGARSLAVDETGQVWQWGTLYSPSSGCDNPGDCLRQTTRVAGLTNVASVAAGGSFSLALKQDGTVWAWGKNEIYQLRQGSNVVEYAAEPLIVPGLSEVIALCASDNFSLALKKDGSVWAWGHNPMGALGNDKTPTSNVPYMYKTIPAQVVELGGVKSIACGVSHSVALDQSGQVWAWGNNQQGELGWAALIPTTIPGQRKCLVCKTRSLWPRAATTPWPSAPMAACGRGVKTRPVNWAMKSARLLLPPSVSNLPGNEPAALL